MNTQLVISLEAVKYLLNDLAQSHGDVVVDLEIIDFIVSGWSGNKSSLKIITKHLHDLANNLIKTYDL